MNPISRHAMHTVETVVMLCAYVYLFFFTCIIDQQFQNSIF